MKNVMQLKALIKNIASEKSISAQLVMQNYMLERLLERIAVSKYQPNFILKGGFLIAAIIGLDSRATMDMDATLKGLLVTKETVIQMFEDICEIKVDDDIVFSVERIREIREDDEYPGFRISLNALFHPMLVPLKIDVTTGDKITPKEIVYDYALLFEDRKIQVFAYNLETVLAEKLETVISRSDQNTRMRDYYDIYILQKLQSENITFSILKTALLTTSEKRNSAKLMKRYSEIILEISKSPIMAQQWLNYQKDFDYANEISFTDACQAVKKILDELSGIIE
ncbi:MAG: nucleotidyl transferase AbiEii/AbiGii toxin family protein [Clostridia bacterium]